MTSQTEGLQALLTQFDEQIKEKTVEEVTSVSIDPGVDVETTTSYLKTVESSEQCEKKPEDKQCELSSDEEYSLHLERDLSDEQIDERREEAIRFKADGNAYFKNKEFTKGEQMYNTALRICPRCVEKRSILYNNRGAARYHLDSEECKRKAIANCEKSIKLNANYVKTYLRGAMIYREMGKDRLDEASADYKKVIELDKNNKEASIAV
ncbi:tetratricopeptide repeat protein 1-like protein [Dinothrombium tinctorium]|uniref:Tetratricopeptide repeat protein 1-like protein n=1 Tax=Dinothrombium tinctorium TaxID=1965070 RepID=A0A443QYA1_9ACAR|nr:tetratricopeptide repeat protein 1-like protein [Dinothrombium tinctorium]